MVRVKICGITSKSEAEWAVEAGADALGFVFVPASRRYVEPSLVREISRQLPPFVARVGVFRNSAPAEVAEVVKVSGITVIQLHGEEDPSRYTSIGLPLIKSISLPLDDHGKLMESEELANVNRLVEDDVLKNVQALLLDSCYRGRAGGTGRILPWQDSHIQRLRAVCRKKGIPFILAGGLTPENVHDGIGVMKPYAVDVSSGVEEGGKKTKALIKAFICRAKGDETRAGD